MANAVYPLFKQALLTTGSANISLDTDTAQDGVYCALVDTGTYTYSATHQYYNSLAGIVGTDQRITAPTVANGTLKGGNITFTAVSGPTIEALVIYRHNAGANTTWRLVAYLDTGVAGLPATPNGDDINVTWDPTGIFSV
jgi:hypothetical protein